MENSAEKNRKTSQGNRNRESEGYKDKEFARWSRKCRICGYKQYTDKQTPAIKEYKPDFGV